MLPPDCAMLVDAVRRLAPDLIETHHRGAWVSLSIRGLEVARVWISRRRVEFGIGEAREKLDHRNEHALERLIQEAISRRRPEAEFRNEMIFRYQRGGAGVDLAGTLPRLTYARSAVCLLAGADLSREAAHVIVC